MRNKQKDYMFNYLISGMEQKMQATLSAMYHNSCHIDEMNHRIEMEQMKEEITADVMSRITIRLEDEALKQLRDMLNSLGN